MMADVMMAVTLQPPAETLESQIIDIKNCLIIKHAATYNSTWWAGAAAAIGCAAASRIQSL